MIPFELQPSLKGDLLELRPLRPEDSQALYAVASDPLIWEQHPCSDRWKEDVFKVFFREALESGGAFRIIDNKDERTIGSSRFHGYDPRQSQIEIGWTFLTRSHWGGRYNRELKQLMLDHALRFVKSVVFVVGPNNIRSQRALGKVGAVRAGTKHDSNGRENLVYRIEASNWQFESLKAKLASSAAEAERGEEVDPDQVLRKIEQLKRSRRGPA